MSCAIIALVLAAGGICLVPVVGVVAAIAIPAFINYTKRAKTTEAGANLRMMYAGAATYYAEEHVAPDGGVLQHCTVDPATTPNVPGKQKTTLVGGLSDDSFNAIGFTFIDPIYYQYEIVGGPSRCGVAPNEAVYTFRAHGDLDGDGVLSTFEISVASNPDDELYRSPGIYTENELE